jgi:hypothetical protein
LAVPVSSRPGDNGCQSLKLFTGIECDGRNITPPVARDRDRLRQQILETWAGVFTGYGLPIGTGTVKNLGRAVEAIEKRKAEIRHPPVAKGDKPSCSGRVKPNVLITDGHQPFIQSRL